MIMDPTSLSSLIETLDDNIDDLEEIFSPLLKTALSDTVQKLPLLDKAQFYVLITYSIESILFCKIAMTFSDYSFQFPIPKRADIAYLRLHGASAKEHPVFRELTRVKQYFEKIKVLESRDGKEAAGRSSKLDKAAANRFIKHALVRRAGEYLSATPYCTVEC